METWATPVAQMLQANASAPEMARTIARLGVAVSRGLLLDVLATGDGHEVDAAMHCFLEKMMSPIWAA